MVEARLRLAIFAGATATILNSAPLVTSNQARQRRGLDQLTDEWGRRLPYDVLRPQRLAKAATLYVEQFSAHPLERDAAHLYGPPDGYINSLGEFHEERQSPGDTPVYEVTIRPEDGLVPLPYMAVQRDGSAWEGDAARVGATPEESRQPHYPDASRVFEEIDRLGLDHSGVGNSLASQADYDFFRVLPPGGYPIGRRAHERSDFGEGDIDPEHIWEDYFPYRPRHFRREPPRHTLAQVTNRVAEPLSSGRYDGALWLEGSPFIEETIYWLSLLIDTSVPIVACASPDHAHGVPGAGGDRQIIDALRYIRSRVWADEAGKDRVGPVLLSAEQIFTAREVQKADARPAGYVATGGHGGIVATTGDPGPPVLTFAPIRQHTFGSSVRLPVLPVEVRGVSRARTGPAACLVTVKNSNGHLIPDSIPYVSFVKHARYLAEDASESPESEVEILARIARNLERHPLSGFVLEGGVPYGSASPSIDAALRIATNSGMPVVRTGRGNAEGFVPTSRVSLAIAGGNLTASKARILLMACLLRFGALPPASNPGQPTREETTAIEQALVPYQEVFDSH